MLAIEKYFIKDLASVWLDNYLFSFLALSNHDLKSTCMTNCKLTSFVAPDDSELDSLSGACLPAGLLGWETLALMCFLVWITFRYH